LFFKQVLYHDLGCASYLLGDGGQALIVDPRWDIGVYVEIARAQQLCITQVLDTHDHADHVSGRRRLAKLTGARSLRPGPPDESGGDTILPGAEIEMDALRMRAMATPGHRPEHLALVVSDLSRGPDPWLVLTGDSLLVGDLARPDLASDAREGAGTMHRSLRALLELGDHVEIWPGHVGGSLCGGTHLSAKTSSTLGFERLHNPLLMMEREPFVGKLAQSLPPRPPSVERIVELNRAGAVEPPEASELTGAQLRALVQSGAVVLDARTPVEFDEGHLVGAINLPLHSPGVGTRAGWSFSSDERFVIVAADATAARAMSGALQAVGLWGVRGYVIADADSWRALELPLAQARSWDVEELARALRDHRVELVDVRDPHEWVRGHVDGSHHVPLDRLREATRSSRSDRPTAVACMAGGRAAFAASVLRRAGRHDVVRVAGGGVPDLAAHGISLIPGG
jgi:hydroxyacylglutathione hydrolase